MNSQINNLQCPNVPTATEMPSDTSLEQQHCHLLYLIQASPWRWSSKVFATYLALSENGLPHSILSVLTIHKMAPLEIT